MMNFDTSVKINKDVISDAHPEPNKNQSILVLMNRCYSVCTPGLTVQHRLTPTRIEAGVGGQTDQDDMHIHKSIG